ncbi:MAG: uroporphyrinogen-III synthase [Pseudomonadota bacterium]
MHPVIITRPFVQASAFACQVASIGRQAEIFPLLEIQALADTTALDETLSRLSDFAMVAFVSPNAVHAAFLRIQHWPANLAIAVMGAGSRAALAEHGITDDNAKIISPINLERTDSETLLDVLDFSALHGREVLIVRGETGREFLADALRSQGVSVTQIAAYQRVAPEFTLLRQQNLKLMLERENDWVVTSSEALRNLFSWAKKLDLDNAVAKMQRQQIFVPHVRIEETAKNLGFQFITLTGSGDESLLVALQSHL